MLLPFQRVFLKLFLLAYFYLCVFCLEFGIVVQHCRRLATSAEQTVSVAESEPIPQRAA